VDTGTAFIVGLRSMLWPVRMNGVTCASNFSVHASHFSSGEMTKSVANAEMACCRSSLPSSSIDRNARFPSASKVMKNTRSFAAPNCGSAPRLETRTGVPPAAGRTKMADSLAQRFGRRKPSLVVRYTIFEPSGENAGSM
jgi:hypothetical protein